ncbi:hypothetical protein PROFUN_16832 [Planoprotostelium fungivorum]|uniref:Uncharacterized protein n=1 Tax=Planoprotostelium fungivorum TaxID=1890364 RepID=A0A2P6MNT9_9EUKA|nr:hypothetical protein PROFUN_16832 [Planoprotostelium fungivorum]
MEQKSKGYKQNVPPEEMFKTIEQKDNFITKQMMVVRSYKEKLEHQ